VAHVGFWVIYAQEKSGGHYTLHQELSDGIFSSSDLHWIRFGLQPRLSITCSLNSIVRD